MHGFSREDQKEFQKSLIADGLCENCGQGRGEDGTKRMCRPCANESNARKLKWRKARKDQKSIDAAPKQE
jgi:hypothetical protein